MDPYTIESGTTIFGKPYLEKCLEKRRDKVPAASLPHANLVDGVLSQGEAMQMHEEASQLKLLHSP